MQRTSRGPTKTEQTRVCSLCGGTEFYDDDKRGESICTSCGCVQKSNAIDTGPEWRAFTAEERDARARTGSPMTLTIADRGLSTTIGWENRDARGNALKSNTRAAIYRMRKWQIRTYAHNYELRNLRVALNELGRLCSQLGIPDDAEQTAAFIYRKALKKRLPRGRSIEAMIAACVYLSCRIHRIPRQLDEMVEETRIKRKELAQAVRLIQQHVDVYIPIPQAIDLMPRISADLGVSGKVVQTATDIINKARKIGVTAGKDPGGIAAASLYIAGIIEDDRRTQREIAEASNVTEVTVRNRYKELVRSLEISMDPQSGSFK